MMVHTNFVEMNKAVINESLTTKNEFEMNEYDLFVLETWLNGE